VLGYGIASDAKGVGQFDPRGFGIERAMKLALESADLKPDDIGAIWSAQSGFRLADRAEEQAIRRLFGDNAAIQSPKMLLGEPMGVGPAMETSLALEAWKHQEGGEKKAVLVNGSSLGGTHLSIVLAPYSDR
jgi:3-oxoacyl-[acyl-carrier-protein] synthase II